MTEVDRINDLTHRIIGAAMDVHRALGPGLLESAYAACLAFELVDRGLEVERERPLPVIYRSVTLDCAYRIDLLVNREIIVELKSVDKVVAIHKAQLRSYLKLANVKVGLLMNFNVEVLRDGITRVVNGL
ncbi:MAG: GxxExxY protein [Phycisphaeraceae bacterium]